MSTCKIVLLGDSAVGKSSLVVQFVEGQFSEFQPSTVGAAFLTKSLQIKSNTVKLEIWDTAGQERYRSLAPMYYRGALGAVVVFDTTNKDSLLSAKTWVSELREKGTQDMIIALAGNKADLTGSVQVTAEEAKELAASLRCNFYMETSAKTGLNVSLLFEKLTEEYIKSGPVSRETMGDIFPLSPSPGPKSKCC